MRREEKHGNKGIGPAKGLWLFGLSGRAGGADRCAAPGAGCLRHYAHRRRQEPVLPDPRPAAGRGHAGDLSPDLPDAGPGHGPEKCRCSRSLYQQFPDPGPDPAGLPQYSLRNVQDHLCGPGAAADRRLSGGHPGPEGLPGDGGRGPLHLPMGPGFPAQLSENCGFSEHSHPTPRGFRLYRHGNGGSAPGHRPDFAAARSPAGGHGL